MQVNGNKSDKENFSAAENIAEKALSDFEIREDAGKEAGTYKKLEDETAFRKTTSEEQQNALDSAAAEIGLTSPDGACEVETIALETHLDGALQEENNARLELELKARQYDEIISSLKASREKNALKADANKGLHKTEKETDTYAVNVHGMSESVAAKENKTKCKNTYFQSADPCFWSEFDMGVTVGSVYHETYPNSTHMESFVTEPELMAREREQIRVDGEIYHVSDAPRYTEHLVVPEEIFFPVGVEGEHTVRVIKKSSADAPIPFRSEHTVYISEKTKAGGDYLPPISPASFARENSEEADAFLERSGEHYFEDIDYRYEKELYPEATIGIDATDYNEHDYRNDRYPNISELISFDEDVHYHREMEVDRGAVPKYEDYSPEYHTEKLEGSLQIKAEEDYSSYEPGEHRSEESVSDHINYAEPYSDDTLDFSPNANYRDAEYVNLTYSDMIPAPSEFGTEHYEYSYEHSPEQNEDLGLGNIDYSLGEEYHGFMDGGLSDYEREIALDGADAIANVGVYDENITTPVESERYDFSSYNKRELALLIKKHKKNILNLRKRQAELSDEAYALNPIRLIVDKLNIIKEIIDERVSVLSACTAIGSSRLVRENSDDLLKDIYGYNIVAREYAKETGFTLAEVSAELPDDILLGKSYVLPPYVKYVEEEAEPILDNLKFARARDARRNEKRALIDALVYDNKRDKGRSDASSGNQIKAVLAVKSRFEYQINECRDRLAFLKNSYAVDESKRSRECRELSRKIKKLERSKKRALVLEKEDSKRYLSALLPSVDSCTSQRKKERLESLRLRLDTVLKERESIENKLINLYTGDAEANTTLMRKTSGVRNRSTRRIAAKFKRDMRILKERVPLDIKQKLVKIVNELIDKESRIKALRYQRKKMKKSYDARRDLAREIKLSERSLKPVYSDYKSMLKRARRYEEKTRDKRVQAFWIMGVLIAALAIAAVYSVFF